MSVNFGNINTSRYYNVPDEVDFTLPDSDWTWVGVIKSQANGTNPGYLVSTGNFQTANSFNFFINSGQPRVGCVYNANIIHEAAIAPSADVWNVVYVARRSGNLYVGWKPQGGGTGSESTALAITGTSNGSSLILGGRADLNTDRMWKGSVSWVALLKGKGLTATEVNDLAAGTTVLMNASYAAQVSNLWWLQSSTPPTVTDSVNSRIATKQGTGYSADDTDPLPPIASLDASSCDQTDTSGAGSLIQVHALTSTESTETDASSSGALVQTHVLSASNSTQADASSTGAIASSGDLAAANCTQTDTAATGAIAQTHSIAVENSTQTDISGTGAIDVGSVINLAAANSTQNDACQTAIITQTHLLIIAPSVQDDVAATSSIVQQHILVCANSIQWDACSTDNLIGDNVILPTSSRITGGMFKGEINSHGL